MKRRKIADVVKLRVINSQSKRCRYCDKRLKTTSDGIPLYDIDHIHMHAIGGSDEIDNLQALCLNCHRIKSVREMRDRYEKNKKEKIELENVEKNKEPNPFEKFVFKNH